MKRSLLLLPLFCFILSCRFFPPYVELSVPNIGLGNDKSGSLILDSANAARALRSARGGREASLASLYSEPFFAVVADETDHAVLDYVEPDGSELPPRRQVFLIDAEGNSTRYLPNIYPDSFELGGTTYLLFGGNHYNGMKVYAWSSATATEVDFSPAPELFDFSAVWEGLTVYSDYPEVACPVFCAARNTLYFSMNYSVAEPSKAGGGYKNYRIFRSRLAEDGKTFLSPEMIGGEMDPYDGSHYRNGLRHSAADFPGQQGIWSLARLVLTGDGSKAFFTILQTNADFGGIMNEGDPFIGPEPNNQVTTSQGIEDPRTIWTYVCSADIDEAGNFSNVSQLSAAVNRGGINYVSDVSTDGSTLMIMHIDLPASFWTFSSQGPDSIAANNMMVDPPWRFWVHPFIMACNRDSGDWAPFLTINSLE